MKFMSQNKALDICVGGRATANVTLSFLRSSLMKTAAEKLFLSVNSLTRFLLSVDRSLVKYFRTRNGVASFPGTYCAALSTRLATRKDVLAYDQQFRCHG